MKILYCTDLHGNLSCYDQLAEVARMAEADVVINGGDMLPKDGDLFRVAPVRTRERFIWRGRAQACRVDRSVRKGRRFF